MNDDAHIESTLSETRTFEPSIDFVERAGRGSLATMDEYRRAWQRSMDEPERYWAEQAAKLPWLRKWDTVVEGGLPDARWFVGGELNLAHACADAHVEAGRGEDVAIDWEGEPWNDGEPEQRRLTYRELSEASGRMASGLASLGVRKGDVVTLYMGMVPELVVAMLACARLGAAHSVIFGGFAATAIAERTADAGSRVIVTCDGAWRRGKIVPLKLNVDTAAATLPDLEKVVVVRRCGNDIAWKQGRDVEWDALLEAGDPGTPCVPVESGATAFLLYTSGSTGKPKGIVHATGGYLVHAATTAREVFHLNRDRDQTFWCTADIGWITGHSYVAYGILASGVRTLMYEGAPDFPAADRFWSIVERHHVTQLYTAPTAIRAFMKWGDEHPGKHDLSSLFLLGTVGEPINPEAWMWYRRVIGGDRCPIVDTWWQTETGGHMIAPLPAATPTVPGSCTLPLPGVDAAIVDEKGREVPAGQGGLLVIRKPWPGMLRGIHGDRERFLGAYFSRVPGFYFTGDGARRDERGNFWIMGRVDDVMNVAGHRLGTMEIESALVSHPAVVEAAVVGFPHDLKGTGVAAFVTLAPGTTVTPELRDALAQHVAGLIGAIARPDRIRFTDALPKTRSGKIMRRLLRDVAAGRDSAQDVTTLEDFSVLVKLREQDEE